MLILLTNGDVMNIDGIAYGKLLETLSMVYKESEIKVEDDLSAFESPVVQKALSSMPPMTLEQVIKKVSDFVEEDFELFGYEAANRAKQPELAQEFLKGWQKRIDKRMFDDFPGGSEPNPMSAFFGFATRSVSHVSCNYSEMEEKLNKLFKRIKWPKFQGDDAESQIQKVLTHCLSKELVFRKFHKEEPTSPAPPHAACFFAQTSPTAPQSYLIQKYANRLGTITFNDNDRPRITDDMIRIYLDRFTNAESLDLSNCVLLTDRCFGRGHQKIHNIDLTGTQLSKSELVASKLFPKLQTIKQEKQITVFNLKDFNTYSLRTKEEWLNFKKRVQESDKVFCDDNQCGKILAGFLENPMIEGMQALLGCQKFMSLEGIVKAFIAAWDKSRDAEFTKKQLEVILDIWPKTKDESIEKLIGETFLEFISMTREIKNYDYNTYPRQERYQTKYMSKERIPRVRHLASVLRNYSWGTTYENVLSRLGETLRREDGKLFSRNLGASLDQEVLQFEFGHELYVEFSHRVEQPLHGPFLDLVDHQHHVRHTGTFNNPSMVAFNPFLNAMTSETLVPGSAYAAPMPQMLACAFVLKTQQREELLKRILDKFSKYEQKSPYYSLPRLVLGVLREEDIPEWDKDSLIKERLLNYKGVFKENISQEIKDRFWVALSEGKLGGHNHSLIDALEDFYHKTPNFKPKVLEALNKIGGVLFNGPITEHLYGNPLNDNEVKKYARERVNREKLD